MAALFGFPRRSPWPESRDWDAGLIALAADRSVDLRPLDQNLTTLRLNDSEMTPSQRALESTVQRLRYVWGLAPSNSKETVQGLAWLHRHRSALGGPGFFRAGLERPRLSGGV